MYNEERTKTTFVKCFSGKRITENGSNFSNKGYKWNVNLHSRWSWQFHSSLNYFQCEKEKVSRALRLSGSLLNSSLAGTQILGPKIMLWLWKQIPRNCFKSPFSPLLFWSDSGSEILHRLAGRYFLLELNQR